jgi:hypothetical protein
MVHYAYDQLEPEGVAEDLRAGVVAAEVANTALNFGFAKGKRFKPENFFASLERLKKEAEKASRSKSKGITQEEYEAWKQSLMRKGSGNKVKTLPPAPSTQPKGT